MLKSEAEDVVYGSKEVNAAYFVTLTLLRFNRAGFPIRCCVAVRLNHAHHIQLVWLHAMLLNRVLF